MRIAITTSILRVPPTYFVVDHAQRMRAQHDFRVFALAADVHDTSMTVPVQDFAPKGPLAFRHRMRLAPFSLPLMGPAIRHYGPDLVHQHFATWCTPAVSAAKSLRVPLVTTLHGYDAFLAARKARTPLDRWHHHNIRAAREGSTRFLAVSEFLASVAVRSGFDPGRLHVHYQGVDSDFFTPSPEGRGDEAPIVLFVGSLSTNKGPRDLIDASRRLIGTVEHQLVLIGTGPLEADLARETASDPQIRLVGRLDRSGIRDWMRRATVKVLPAQEHRGAREAAGLVLLEAQACGTPVVAYDSGGTSEMLVPDVTGVLVPERDTASLGNAIRTVLELSPEDYRELARAARTFVESHRSLAGSCTELAAHYESVR